MAIVYKGVTCFQTNSADPWTSSGIVLPSGTDFIVVGISQKDKINSIVSITWNTTESFTFLRTDENATEGRTHIYYLVNPTVTTADIVADWDVSTKGAMGIVYYSGVDSSPIDVQNGGEGTDDTAEVTLTGVASDCWAFQVVNDDGNKQPSSWSHTYRCQGKTGGSPTTRNGFGTQDTNSTVSGDVTLICTLDAAGNWSTGAFSFKALGVQVVSKLFSSLQ